VQTRPVNGNSGNQNPLSSSNKPAYPGQARVVLRLPANPSGPQVTTVTTGVMALTLPLQAGDITGFATRFGSTFDEYRILGVDVEALNMSASTGATAMWFDEKSQSAPTQNESTERNATTHLNTNAGFKSRKVLRWRARDLLDLEFTPIGTANVVPVTFKAYTDLALWGAPIAVTPLWVFRLTFVVEFRGLKSS
jgi:hypothetical protein